MSIARWLLLGLCWAGAAYCLTGAVQEADFSAAANSAVAAQYAEAAMMYWRATLILAGSGVIFFILLTPLDRR